jgi:carbamoyltransferase
MEGGNITAFVEEERLTRVKHGGGSVHHPLQSIKEVLNIADLKLSDLDRIATSRNPDKKKHTRIDIAKRYFRSDLPPIERLYYSTVEPFKATHRSTDDLVSEIRNDIATHLDVPVRDVPEVVPLNHHLSHAASSYYFSGFDEGLAISMDERGDRYSTTIYRARHGEMERVESFSFHSSLGRFYAMITEFLGYRKNNGEGKVMGLAPYGEENPAIERVLDGYCEYGGGEYDVTDLTLRTYGDSERKLAEDLGFESRYWRGEITQEHKDLTYHAQSLLEDIVTDLVEHYVRETGIPNVCLAGGVALNCKMNKRVRELPVVDEIFVQPVANDAGGAIGAAGEVSQRAGHSVSKMTNVYHGTEFSAGEVAETLSDLKLSAEEPNDVYQYVAERLADEALVGWFQGRMEGGPRALGNRSILADPRTKESLHRVNEYVKHREEWRPFAPSMLPSAADRYLIGETSDAAWFMIDTYDTVNAARDEITAVLHPADNTTRPQVVLEETAPRYHRLLSEFRDATGVGVVLNTSFNDSGEPIVRTPREAVRDFFSMGLDVLVLGDRVLKKQ